MAIATWLKQLIEILKSTTIPRQGSSRLSIITSGGLKLMSVRRFVDFQLAW